MGTAISCYRTLYCYLEKREIRDRGKFGAKDHYKHFTLHLCVGILRIRTFFTRLRQGERGWKIIKITFNVYLRQVGRKREVNVEEKKTLCIRQDFR